MAHEGLREIRVRRVPLERKADKGHRVHLVHEGLSERADGMDTTGKMAQMESKARMAILGHRD